MPAEVREWVIRCAAAEVIGMTAAAAAARSADTLLGNASPARTAAAWAAVVGAGCLEAFTVGVAQSGALRRRVPVLDRWRFVLVTVVVAGLTWAASELPVLTSGSGSAGGAPAWPLLAVGGAALGVVAGCLLGLAQAAVLPRNLRRRSAWVAGSALGWAAAMATIMLGASTAGEGWPLPTLLAWAGLTGAVAGGLLGLVLAWFVVSLDGQPLSTRVVLRALRAGRPRRLSRSVVGLRVTGRVSGSTYELPVMYVTHDDDLWVMVGGSVAKTWWRNVSRDTRVEVLRHGRWAPATADLVGPTDPPFLNGLAWYLTRWPRAKPAPDDPMVRLRSVHERHDSYAGSYGPAGSAGSRKPGTQR